MNPRLARALAQLVPLLALGLVARSASADGPTKVECNARYEQGLSLRAHGKLQAARGALVTCASTSCPSQLREECARRAEEVNAQLPSVVFEVKDAEGADLSNVTIVMDGAPLTSKLDGSAITIDPGEHAFQLTVSGQPPVARTLLIREGDKGRRERVVIGSPPPEAPAVPATPVLPAATRPAPEPAPAEAGGSRRHVIAYVVGGAGIVGIGVGAAFGAAAFSQWSSAKSDCPTACGANTTARNDATREKSIASTSATVSTAGFIAGGVGVAAGAVLLLLSPGRSTQAAGVRIAPLVGGSTAGLVAEGFW